MAGVVATVKGVIDRPTRSEPRRTRDRQGADDTEESASTRPRSRTPAGDQDAAPTVTGGVLSGLVAGVGVVAIAGGVILGALIMYYLLKDGAPLRQIVVDRSTCRYRDEVDGFIGDACRILRDYGKGRTVMSAIVSAVVGSPPCSWACRWCSPSSS